MQVAVFSQKPYWRKFFDEANLDYGHQLTYFEPALNTQTVALAAGHGAVCVFVHDQVDGEVLLALQSGGTRLVLPGGGQLVLADGQTSVEIHVVQGDVSCDTAKTIANEYGPLIATGKAQTVSGWDCGPATNPGELARCSKGSQAFSLMVQ